MKWLLLIGILFFGTIFAQVDQQQAAQERALDEKLDFAQNIFKERNQTFTQAVNGYAPKMDPIQREFWASLWEFKGAPSNDVNDPWVKANIFIATSTPQARHFLLGNAFHKAHIDQGFQIYGAEKWNEEDENKVNIAIKTINELVPKLSYTQLFGNKVASSFGKKFYE